MFGEVRKEESFIVISLNECMSGITISSDSGHDNETIIILKFSWLHYTCRTSADGFFVNTSGIIDSESNIFNSVTMVSEVGIEFFVSGWV